MKAEPFDSAFVCVWQYTDRAQLWGYYCGKHSPPKKRSLRYTIIIDCIALAKQGDNRIASIRPSVNALTAEPFDLWPWYLAWGSTFALARLGL